MSAEKVIRNVWINFNLDWMQKEEIDILGHVSDGLW